MCSSLAGRPGGNHVCHRTYNYVTTRHTPAYVMAEHMYVRGCARCRGDNPIPQSEPSRICRTYRSNDYSSGSHPAMLWVGGVVSPVHLRSLLSKGVLMR